MNRTLHPSIANLDLDLVAHRLRTKSGWEEDRIEQAIAGYREFLQCVRDAGQGAHHRPPSDDVDEVWHAHILHTRKYAEDCDAILGWHFHHTPDAPRRKKNDSDAADSDSVTDSCSGLWGWWNSWFGGDSDSHHASGTESGHDHASSDAGHGADSGGDVSCGGGGDGGGGSTCGGGCGGD